MPRRDVVLLDVDESARVPVLVRHQNLARREVEVALAVQRLRGGGRVLVAQAHVQRQVVGHPPVVLEEGGVVPGRVLDVGDVLDVRLRRVPQERVAQRISRELAAEPESAAGLRNLEQVELRLPNRGAAAHVVIPDEVSDRIRELELLAPRVGRVVLRIADERVGIGSEHGQAVDPRVQRYPGNLEVRRRNERASDRDADARRQLVEADAELVEGAIRQGLASTRRPRPRSRGSCRRSRSRRRRRSLAAGPESRAPGGRRSRGRRPGRCR